MDEREFRALVVHVSESGEITRRIERRKTGDLPAGDVLVRVKYSSLNYKDALSASGNRGVTKTYPHTPGIDAAGIVVDSSEKALEEGAPVIVSGFDLGVGTAGGFGEYIRVPLDWVIPAPPGLSLRECMIYGTAGFTAALSVGRLLELGVTPDAGEIIVTGASGGVGSFAVALLTKQGFRVTAATGKKGATGYLRELGAGEVLLREALLDSSERPLLDRKWAAGVDTVGGRYLETVLRSVKEGGVVTCCGNAASANLELTVYPFILRGVSLCGIDSANCPASVRRETWDRLAGEWKIDQLEDIVWDCTLEELDKKIDTILNGEITGRVVVSL